MRPDYAGPCGAIPALIFQPGEEWPNIWQFIVLSLVPLAGEPELQN